MPDVIRIATWTQTQPQDYKTATLMVIFAKKQSYLLQTCDATGTLRHERLFIDLGAGQRELKTKDNNFNWTFICVSPGWDIHGIFTK